MDRELLIIDAHAHLWLRQSGEFEGKKIIPLPNGRADFMGLEVQMLPPFMIDGKNSAEIFLSNMDYAQVSAAVITQEFIDGFQNDYLREVGKNYPGRFLTMGMCDFRKPGFIEIYRDLISSGFKGIAIPAHRLPYSVSLNSDEMMTMFKDMESKQKILSITLSEDSRQVSEFEEVIKECPHLKVAVGHFGMAPRRGWERQVALARNQNVMIESGGITWLFNSEFYPYHGAIEIIRKAADMVGIEKLMWGSDYPRTITAITYKMSYDFVLKANLLSWEEKKAFLGGNARLFYGFVNLVHLPYIKNMSE